MLLIYMDFLGKRNFVFLDGLISFSLAEKAK